MEEEKIPVQKMELQYTKKTYLKEQFEFEKREKKLIWYSNIFWTPNRSNYIMVNVWNVLWIRRETNSVMSRWFRKSSRARGMCQWRGARRGTCGSRRRQAWRWPTGPQAATRWTGSGRHGSRAEWRACRRARGPWQSRWPARPSGSGYWGCRSGMQSSGARARGSHWPTEWSILRPGTRCSPRSWGCAVASTTRIEYKNTYDICVI